MALNNKPNAYRNSQRLMKLATLLRIDNDIDNIQGTVWIHIARKKFCSMYTIFYYNYLIGTYIVSFYKSTCMSVSLCVYLFPNSSETANPSELKF